MDRAARLSRLSQSSGEEGVGALAAIGRDNQTSRMRPFADRPTDRPIANYRTLTHSKLTDERDDLVHVDLPVPVESKNLHVMEVSLLSFTEPKWMDPPSD